MTVAEHVRRDLDRRRRMGQSFPQAWRAAKSAALAGLPKHEREGWSAVLTAHRDEWQAGYEGRALSPSAAAVASIEDLWADEPADRGALAAR